VIDKCVKLIIYTFSRKVLICLKFMQMCNEEGHDSLEKVAVAMLKEEKVMKTKECDDNSDLLAIVPYVNLSSPLHQQSSLVGEPIILFLKYMLPRGEVFFVSNCNFQIKRVMRFKFCFVIVCVILMTLI